MYGEPFQEGFTQCFVNLHVRRFARDRKLLQVGGGRDDDLIHLMQIVVFNFDTLQEGKVIAGQE